MIYGTPFIILALAVMLYILRVAYFKDLRSGPLLSFDKILWPLTFASLIVLLFALSAALLPEAVAVPAIVAEVLVLCVLAVINVANRQYFGIALWQLYRAVSTGSFKEVPWSDSKTYVFQYFSFGFLAWMVGAVMAALLLSLLLGLENLSAPESLMATLLAIGAWKLAPRFADHRKLSDAEKAFLKVNPSIGLSLLKTTDRTGQIRLNGEVRYKPRTIILIINESAGRYLPSSDGPAMSFQQKLLRLSGNPEEWFVPDNAVTNSSCTDVVMPSMLTGTGAHESYDKLHRMPFVFDIAKARGYRTAFFTSSTLNWANFNLFFAGAKIDALFTAQTSGLPYVNDLTVDDVVPVMELAGRITAADEPLFAVAYTNALHVPFQATSCLDIPARLVSRKSRALYLVEMEHKILFDALKASKRYDDALIVTVGDHGDRLDDPLSPKWTLSRLENYSEPILRPVFMIKPPRDLPADMADALRRNAGALVAHLDIAPTLADMLGVSLSDGLAYQGFSLFRPIPDNRLAVATSLSEWRAWPRGAVALIRGRSRLVCDGQDLCQYFDTAGPTQADESRREALIAEAMNIPVVRESIAQIYQARFGAV